MVYDFSTCEEKLLSRIIVRKENLPKPFSDLSPILFSNFFVSLDLVVFIVCLFFHQLIFHGCAFSSPSEKCTPPPPPPPHMNLCACHMHGTRMQFCKCISNIPGYLAKDLLFLDLDLLSYKNNQKTCRCSKFLYGVLGLSTSPNLAEAFFFYFTLTPFLFPIVFEINGNGHGHNHCVRFPTVVPSPAEHFLFVDFYC